MSSDPSVPDARAVAETIDSKDLVFGRTVVPVKDRNKAPKKGKLGFEYAEHCFIGDAITLTLANGTKVAASDYKFQLKDQLSLTYGQINGLAGDFYGTYDPISDGKDDQDRSARFVRAYNTLADGGPRLPKEAMDILADPSVVYAQLPDVSLKLELITFGRSGHTRIPWASANQLGPLGADARTAYNAGHATAIQKAISGDLDGAYAMNAFADHFLEDSFSAGHLRTPRRLLHRSTDITADACAKFMHDEDNAIGIEARIQEVSHGRYSVQASADEIYKAYQTKQAPSPTNYQAWTFAPTLESANAHQTLATLFTFQGREAQGDRESEATSGWWNYPITINGLQNIIPWSSVAVTTPKSEHLDGLWGGGPSKDPLFNAVLFTPLAAINFNDGKEIRVYYLDEQYVLQEYCYSADQGKWFPGELGNMKIQAATNTSIAAMQYGDDRGGVYIRVYCQELGSGAIKEFCNNGYWFRGATLPVALSGSSLAAVVYSWNGLQLRVYYQTDDLSIKEHCINDKSGEWFPGKLDFGKAPGCVPISAIGYGTSNGGAELHVYWRNLDNEIVGTKNTGSWGPVNTVVGGLKPGTQFAAAQWSNGKNLRLYYQTADDSVLEMVNDSGFWVGGATVGNVH
ncbi:fungal fucose-specific lectin-domain-containing protein [Desarmillaria tabescens]|uniref:Fungal fucose-specific lectin-domain-containing protein n=1 Tax=Armillaria tabescens TaxID=1929756 RepID=A0AA39J8L5_ARMTA|nr:fungal fucose-specific lectin-domain-containing protein [Desarmillaria tabescens]KAK0438157.1 fungal fucose-specific lectin-domain-containing protein [Desarmillaria tabescens]